MFLVLSGFLCSCFSQHSQLQLSFTALARASFPFTVMLSFLMPKSYCYFQCLKFPIPHPSPLFFLILGSDCPISSSLTTVPLILYNARLSQIKEEAWPTSPLSARPSVEVIPYTTAQAIMQCTHSLPALNPLTYLHFDSHRTNCHMEVFYNTHRRFLVWIRRGRKP